MKCHGIIIGIDQYEIIGSLKGCVNDAMSFDARLGRISKEYLGTIIPLYVNEGYHKQYTPTKSHILAAIQQLKELQIHKDDYIFFFYAGHGLHSEDLGHVILPIDFVPGLISETGLSINFLGDQLRTLGSKNIILILDACRKIHYRKERFEQKGFDKFSKAGIASELNGILTFLSCMMDQYSVEYGTTHPKGLFTYSLLKSWSPDKEDLSFLDLYRKTKAEMASIINAEFLRNNQECSMLAEPIEKADIFIPKWESPTPIGRNTLSISYPIPLTVSKTVNRCQGSYEGEYKDWKNKHIWINLLDQNGNRYLQQPKLTLHRDGSWAQENINVGDNIEYLEVLEADDLGNKYFENKVVNKQYGAFNNPPGIYRLAIVRLS